MHKPNRLHLWDWKGGPFYLNPLDLIAWKEKKKNMNYAINDLWGFIVLLGLAEYDLCL